MPARRRDPLARDLPAELQVAATNGSILTDSRGRKYIDFVMGWCVGNFGWRPITKSMYFLPRESVTMLPFVAATCSSAGSSLASGSRRRAGMNIPFRAQPGRLHHYRGLAASWRRRDHEDRAVGA